jgi:hypothetical protein
MDESTDEAVEDGAATTTGDPAAGDARDVGEDLAAETGTGAAPLREFVRALRAESDGALRAIVRYDAEAERYETRFLREDLAERFDESERAARAEALSVQALGDPTEEAALPDFGELEATMRWYADVVVATFPTGEWSGVVATLDRTDSPLVDVALEHLDD